MECKHISCLGCNRDSFTDILDLGLHPWGGGVLEKEEIGKEPYYPLKLLYCNNCELLQLSYRVPKETMFKHHKYLSGTTKTLTEHFLNLAIENIKQYNINPEDVIVDIGGNDGTQLLQYKKRGIHNTINIESASNISEISKQNGIITHNDFFNLNFCKKMFPPSSVKLINASGVFFHLEELQNVIKGIEYLLKDNGIFVAQFMYAGSMLDNLNFDTIYHEHLCYYTIKSFLNLFKDTSLRIDTISYSDIHSGSIIAKLIKNNSTALTNNENELIKLDYSRYTLDYIMGFSKKVQKKRDSLRDILLSLKKYGKRIYAYGAPVKGNTLLNYLKIDDKIIEKAVEINPLKIGKYLPGSHIPIVKESALDLPDYYLLLSHNFKDEIIKKNSHISSLKYIIPFPDITIVS